MMETHLVTAKGITPDKELQQYIDYELQRSEHIETNPREEADLS